jgi:hypothetical protein
LSDYKKSVEARRAKALVERGNEAVNSLHGFLAYFKEAHAKPIVAFSQSKADMFVTDRRKVPDQEMKKRMDNLKSQVRRLVVTLVE